VGEIVISLRKQVEQSEHFAPRLRALLKAFTGLAAALPKAAQPASPAVSEQCTADLERSTAQLNEEAPVKAIDEAAKIALQQLEVICTANRAALGERDAALKDAVAVFAGAINGFRGAGQRHNSSLSKLANNFDSLAQLEEVTELRRQLRTKAAELRHTADEMRRESEESVRSLEAKVSSFKERLELARQESGLDRLTGLGSRREAERQMQKLASHAGSICILLFDIEGFREINERQGTLFGDKLLQALAHTLRAKFTEEGTLFRWGADEFLAIAIGAPQSCLGHGRDVCASFASTVYYYTGKDGSMVPLRANVACGVAQYLRGETGDDLYRRGRESLEQSRKELRR
jgi:diguanylate cyclase (GGDEF)-like protein